MMDTRSRSRAAIVLVAVSLVCFALYGYSFLMEMERTDQEPANIQPSLLQYVVWPSLLAGIGCGLAAVVIAIRSLTARGGRPAPAS